MGAKGKKRREKNYRAAHGGPARLPPPPKPSQVEALPSKLRMIMSFAQDETRKKSGDETQNKSQQENEGKLKPHGSKDGAKTTSGSPDGDGEMVQKNGSGRKQKRKRKREEVTDLRFETALVEGTKRREKKKMYFKAKKEKRKKVRTNKDLEFTEKEKIKFGEVVEAPPKLVSVPKPFKTNQDASKERVRSQVIKAYRERKGWSSRPGGIQFPPSALS